ncbi:MAG: DUF4080 domain-containing protein [Deltaproteobacteria bacterium]|nr:DUF4080 domain-containing protein [Deltaproteobacteria bacterium]
MDKSASIGLVALNAKYVHAAPAVRYLRNAARQAGFSGVWTAEYTIQTPLWRMAQEIFSRRPAVVGISVYIWNREEALALAEMLKGLMPETWVVLGGPEVSFDPAPPPPADVLISGEGERKWVELLNTLAQNQTPTPEQLSRWKTYGTDLPPLTQLPWTEEDLEGIHQRMVYLETSRGCPYSCSFCLSSLDKQVRRFDDQAVREHLSWLMAQGARRIKFLDRTFNLDRAKTLAFFQWLTGFSGCQFHFEIVAGLLDDPLLDFLDTVPPGMFQFEVGVQTTDPAVKAAVNRRQQEDRLGAAVARLAQAGRVHLHADLIWGLPGENLAAIRRSFETVLAWGPHELQLGFLKFLPGAPVNAQRVAHGYRVQSRPPYEFLSHNDLSAEEVVNLKGFEAVYNLYANSGRFRFTLARLAQALPTWDVFQRLAGRFARLGLFSRSLPLDELYLHLLEEFSTNAEAPPWPDPVELAGLLRLDYCHHRRVVHLPKFLREGGKPPSALGIAGHGRGLTVAFRHRLNLAEGRAELTPVPGRVWYTFHYPEEEEGGYFFTPRVEPAGEEPVTP